MAKKITASFIIEILGRPPEHIKESLGEIVGKIKETKGVSVIESKIHEPKEVEMPEEVKKAENAKKIYTSFLDIEAEFDEIDALLTTAFNYMPSNIEISSPAEIAISNFKLSELISGIMLRLHRYDEVTKKLLADRSIIINKMKELMDGKKGEETREERDMKEKAGKKN